MHHCSAGRQYTEAMGSLPLHPWKPMMSWLHRSPPSPAPLPSPPSPLCKINGKRVEDSVLGYDQNKRQDGDGEKLWHEDREENVVK